VPWSTFSFGLEATIILKSGTIIFITTAGCAPTAAGEGRVVGVSVLGAFKRAAHRTD
jgi:hypothetical protein